MDNNKEFSEEQEAVFEGNLYFALISCLEGLQEQYDALVCLREIAYKRYESLFDNEGDHKNECDRSYEIFSRFAKITHRLAWCIQATEFLKRDLVAHIDLASEDEKDK